MTLGKQSPPTQLNGDFAGSQAWGRKLAQSIASALKIASRAMHKFPPGQVLYKSGDPLDRLPFVMSGGVDVVIHVPRSQDAQIIPISFHAGELCLVSYLLNHQPNQAELVVRDAAVVRWVDVAEIEEALLSSPDLQVLLVRFLGNRLREFQARERALATRAVKARLCAGLLRAMADLPATHEQLALRCGVSRPKASIVLKQMEHRAL